MAELDQEGVAREEATEVNMARLPRHPTRFVGRELELGELERVLGSGDSRLITIVGPGGIGKSRLAIEAAQRWTSGSLAPESEEDHSYFVDLAPLASGELLVSAVCDALGLSLGAGDPPKAQLFDYLRHRRLLLLMDNFEHLLDGASFLAELLEQAPLIQLLATSRERLGLHAETQFLLGGLSVPSTPHAPGSLTGGSLELFRDSARRTDRTFELTADNYDDVCNICRLTEGTPLAIVLAASWVTVLAPREIAVELERGVDFLSSRAADVPERQRSMRAVFEHSWALLTPAERIAFARIGIFRGGFTRQAAAAVADASLEVLAGLVNKSLLRRSAESSRYEVHELLREYALEKLREAGAEHARTLHQHAQFYALFLAERLERLRGSHPQGALAEIDRDLDNVRTAWQRLIEERELAALELGLRPLHAFHKLKGTFVEGERALGAAAEALGRASAPRGARDATLLGRCASLRASLCYELWRQDEAMAFAAHALTLLDETTHPADVGHALLTLGVALCLAGRVEEGAAHAERAIQLYRSSPDPWETANALAELGHHRVWLGPDLSESYLTESIALQRSTGERTIVLPRSLRALAAAKCDRGEYPEAQGLAEEALEISRQHGARWVERGCLQTLSEIQRAQGHYGEAEACARAELALARQCFPFTAGLVHTRLAEILKDAGRLDEALLHCREAARTDREFNLAYARLELADIQLLRGELTEGERLFKSCLLSFERLSTTWGIVRASDALGLLSSQLGRPQLAREHFWRAMDHALLGKLWGKAANVLAGVALLLTRLGQAERAAELVGLVAHHPATEPQTRVHRVQPLLTELTPSLSPDRLCAALSRGAALDLEATLRELLESATGHRATEPADVLGLAPGQLPKIALQPAALFAGRYVIGRQLARGGMGAVYEARNVATERRVALKKLHPDLLANEAARQGFELEACVAARVASEHIVQVLDAGIDRETQIPYLVMELLEGQTLETLLADNESLPVARALPLLEQVAKGLDAAHGYSAAHGPSPIVHRDLKPENVFVTRRPDGSLLVKLLDFGIAKVVSDSQRYTRDVRGTPLYMAYEQVTLSEISPQTDIWALGLITYRVLVGHHYWRSAALPSPSLPQLFAEIVALPLVPPSQRIAEQRLPVRLPREFDDWLLCCLERKPERRFPSAGATIVALARAVASSQL